MSNHDEHTKFFLVLAANENECGGDWISEDPRVKATARTAAWFRAIGDACRAKALRPQRGVGGLAEDVEDAASEDAPVSGVLATGSGWIPVSRDSTRPTGR